MKVLCIGHAAYDITYLVEEFPKENTKNRVKNRVECGGGPASNAAYLLGKWGIETYFSGIVGHDLYGHNIKHELEKVHVNTDYLEVSAKHITTSSFIIANRENGSRTVFTYRPSKMKMTNVDYDFTPDYILVDGQEYEMSMKALDTYKDAISIIDAGRPRKEIIDLAKKCTYLVCSKEFAETVTEEKIDFDKVETLESVYSKLEQEFKNNVVVTLESYGCMARINGKLRILPSLKVKALDSTGAGDIFYGAFVYGLVKKFSLEKTLKFANYAGAISVTRVGGRYSMPTLEEMKEVYDRFK